MEPRVLVTLGGVVFQVLVVAGGVIWAVAQIRSTTTQLGTQLQHLTDSIERLRRGVEKVEDRVYEHSGRISRLEAAAEQETEV